MPRLSETQSRVHSLEELGEVIGALRSVSATRVQQAHGVLDSTREYAAVIQDALAEAARALPQIPAEPERRDAPGVVVVFGAEHGFVGGFNERLLAHAGGRRPQGDQLFVTGSRAILTAAERRDPVGWSCAMASQIAGVDDVALRVAEQLARVVETTESSRVLLVYTRSSEGGAARIVTETLLPFDMRSHVSPVPRIADKPPVLSNLSPGALLDGLIEELLFAQLARAATESFASENAARLAAMESAADNVRGKLDDLRRVERELRQEEITTELMDIVTGVEAVTGER